MQLEWGERMRIRVDRLLNPCPVRTDISFGARLVACAARKTVRTRDPATTYKMNGKKIAWLNSA